MNYEFFFFLAGRVYTTHVILYARKGYRSKFMSWHLSDCNYFRHSSTRTRRMNALPRPRNMTVAYIQMVVNYYRRYHVHIWYPRVSLA